MLRNDVNLNAIVTEELMIINNIATYAGIIGFIIKYIMTNPQGVSTRYSRLVAKKSFEKVVFPIAEYKKIKEDRLEQQVQEERQWVQQKDQKMQQKDQQMQQKL